MITVKTASHYLESTPIKLVDGKSKCVKCGHSVTMGLNILGEGQFKCRVCVQKETRLKVTRFNIAEFRKLNLITDLLVEYSKANKVILSGNNIAKLILSTEPNQYVTMVVKNNNSISVTLGQDYLLDYKIKDRLLIIDEYALCIITMMYQYKVFNK